MLLVLNLNENYKIYREYIKSNGILSCHVIINYIPLCGDLLLMFYVILSLVILFKNTFEGQIHVNIELADSKIIYIDLKDTVTLLHSNFCNWSYCQEDCTKRTFIETNSKEISLPTIENNKTRNLQCSCEKIPKPITFTIKNKLMTKLSSPGYFQPTFGEFVEVANINDCSNIYLNELMTLVEIDRANSMVYCANHNILRFGSINWTHIGTYKVNDEFQFSFTIVKDIINVSLILSGKQKISVIFSSSCVRFLLTNPIKTKSSWSLNDVRVTESSKNNSIYLDEENNLILNSPLLANDHLLLKDESTSVIFSVDVVNLDPVIQISVPVELIYEGRLNFISCSTSIEEFIFFRIYINGQLFSRVKQGFVATSFVPDGKKNFLMIRCEIYLNYYGRVRYVFKEQKETVWKYVEISDNIQFYMFPEESNIEFDVRTLKNYSINDQWFKNSELFQFKSKNIFISNISQDLVFQTINSNSHNKITRFTILKVPKIKIMGEVNGVVYLAKDDDDELECTSKHPLVLSVEWNVRNMKNETSRESSKLIFQSKENTHTKELTCTVYYRIEERNISFNMSITLLFYVKLKQPGEAYIGEFVLLQAPMPRDDNQTLFIMNSSGIYRAVDSFKRQNSEFFVAQLLESRSLVVSISTTNFTQPTPVEKKAADAPIEIKISKPPEEIFPEDRISIYCKVTSNPSVTHFVTYWYKVNDFNSITDEDTEDDSRLLFEEISIMDSGIYYCAVDAVINEKTEQFEKRFELKVVGYESIFDIDRSFKVHQSQTEMFPITCGIRAALKEDLTINWVLEEHELQTKSKMIYYQFYKEYYVDGYVPLNVSGRKYPICIISVPNEEPIVLNANVDIISSPNVTLNQSLVDGKFIVTCHSIGIFDKMIIIVDDVTVKEQSIREDITDAVLSMDVSNITHKKSQIICRILQISEQNNFITDAVILSQNGYMTNEEIVEIAIGSASVALVIVSGIMLICCLMCRHK